MVITLILCLFEFVYFLGIAFEEYLSSESIKLPIYQLWPQWSDAFNQYFPFIVTIAFSLLGCPIGYAMAFLYAKIHIIFYKKSGKYKYEQINDGPIPVKDLILNSLFASWFTFSIGYDISNWPLLQDIFTYPDNIAGGPTMVQITTFIGILPWLILIFGAMFAGCWILKNAHVFYVKKKETTEIEIYKENVGNLFWNMLKGFAGISTLFTIISVIINLQSEILVIGNSAWDVLGVFGIILIIIPIFYFPIYIITGNGNKQWITRMLKKLMPESSKPGPI